LKTGNVVDRSVFVASEAAFSDASTSEYDESTVVDFDIAGLLLMIS